MKKIKMSWAWPVAIMLAGSGAAQESPEVAPSKTEVTRMSRDGPGCQEGRLVRHRPIGSARWAKEFQSQSRHPGPSVCMAILPGLEASGATWLLVQGGQPGAAIRVNFEDSWGIQTTVCSPLGWAKFDGSGQARILLGQGRVPNGRLQAWLGGSQNSWWPGPRIIIGSTFSAEEVQSQARPVQTGELLVSEVMKDPAAVSDTSGEWVELFNTTWMRQDIEGFTLTDDAGGGTVLNNGGGGIWVTGRGYRVLVRNGDPASNGGIFGGHEYTAFSLRNGADQVTLARPDGTVVDRISYDDGVQWPDARGQSMQLRPGVESPHLNDSGGVWCASFSSYGAGDLGTPGFANEDC